jgi:hypothetical protein
MSVAEEYMEASESHKMMLERRYGKRTIERLVNEIMDARAMQKWVEENATPCPVSGFSLFFFILFLCCAVVALLIFRMALIILLPPFF